MSKSKLNKGKLKTSSLVQCYNSLVTPDLCHVMPCHAMSCHVMPCHAPNPRYRDTSCLEPEEPMALSQKLAQVLLERGYRWFPYMP